MPGSMPRVIRVLIHYHAPEGHEPDARLPRRGRGAARADLACRTIGAMAHRVHRSGSGASRSIRRRAATRKPSQLVHCWRATSRPTRRCPRCATAIERARSSRLNRYPDPSNSVLRDAPLASATASRSSGSRSATAHATSCSRPARRCSSPAPSSSTPGRRSRSTRSSAAASGARAIRVAARRARAPRPRRDAARDHRRDAAGDRLQPEQPDQHRGRRSRRSPRFVDEVPAARLRDPRRGLLRVQPARRPRRLDRPARRPPEPRAAADLLEGLRALRPARRLRAVRLGGAAAARSTRCASRSSATPLAQAAAVEALRHQDEVDRRVTRDRSPSGSPSRSACARSGIAARRLAGQLLLVRPRRGARRGGGRARAWRSGACSCAAAARSAAPSPALRVTYGLPEENDRFLDALAEVLVDPPGAPPAHPLARPGRRAGSLPFPQILNAIGSLSLDVIAGSRLRPADHGRPGSVSHALYCARPLCYKRLWNDHGRRWRRHPLTPASAYAWSLTPTPGDLARRFGLARRERASRPHRVPTGTERRPRALHARPSRLLTSTGRQHL